MKVLLILLRLVLGSIFFVYGLDGFLHFMPPNPVSYQSGTLSELINSGYLWTLLKATETVGGFLLLTDLYVPMALVILAPIIVNIFFFHLITNPKGWAIGIYPVGVTIVVSELALAWFYRKYFQGVFVRKAIAQIPQSINIATIKEKT